MNSSFELARASLSLGMRLTAVLFVAFLFLFQAPRSHAQDYRLSVDVTPAFANPGDTVTATVWLEVTPAAVFGAQGSTFGLCHDAGLYSLSSATTGADILILPPCGWLADFVTIDTAVAGGFTFGTLHSFQGLCDFGPGCYEIAVATYGSLVAQSTAGGFELCTLGSPSVAPTVVGGGVPMTPATVNGPPNGVSCSAVGGTLELTWDNHGDYSSIDVICDGAWIATLPGTAVNHTFAVPAGSSPICCELVVQECATTYISEPCCVTLIVPPVVELIRCDCNSDGLANVADVIYSLNHLFAGGPMVCEDAADGNDDGSINLGDAITCLNLLFSGATIPLPFPDCGVDPTPDELDCHGATDGPCP